MLLLTAIVLVAAIITAIIAFGGANAPTTGPFVIAFYFFAILFVVLLVVGLAQQVGFVSEQTSLLLQSGSGVT